ncbi:MAG TPA: tyrosinase family protein [Bradyrhizobium sp.]|uniref:tyrosinase family protein n=1 Tax=Bradyrhizobium sp. TaxID=376 RepID=UPI002C4AEB9E|nr:tyrosinase family protein [Bradyrhizobium sp.]HLZ00847.1 tyrosinase family protein [Bradyrhizobium sp.]
MAFTRQNVWELGGDWADPILWYARGVKAMQARPLNDPTSWRFFGAIHGFDQNLWSSLGLLTEGDQPPSDGDMKTYWMQCQHGSWYFLPWHRGYLLALEAVVRDAITQLGGPGATWALPYWNYLRPNQNQLPPAFASPDWPNGTGDNPLYVVQRYGVDGSGNVVIPTDQIEQNALGDAKFVGPGQGGSQGFGGVRTGFAHSGTSHGGVEMQPHDMVHVLVGGGDDQNPGLMSVPDLAGNDPIFYLHHANIDRLWEVWNKSRPSHTDPTEARWVKGPASTGDQAFAMPMPGGTSWTYTPGDTISLATLGYNYDDVSAPAVQPQIAARRQRLGMAPAEPSGRAAAMAEHVEKLGGSRGALSLTGSGASASVHLDHAVRSRVTSSLQGMAGGPPEPDRIFLNLENVRGANDATVFSVYINVPEGDDPAMHPELKAGSVGLFGLSKASAMDGPHAGNGLNFTIEITHVVDTLHLRGALNVDQLHVRLVPLKPVPDRTPVSIGHISIFRQSG